MAERPLTPQCGVGRSRIGPKSNSIPVPACRSVDGEVTPLRARRRWRQSVGSPVVQLFHVIITGLNRRHLTELGPKHRIVVVGYREKKNGEIEVDAYLNAREEQWLGKRGY